MKRFMWFLAMLPVIVTSIVLQFMPDVIPMHHDLAGNTDRWGSKMESFIFPIVILFITLFSHILICVFEKKSSRANTEKEQMEAKSVAKVLGIVGLSEAIMFGIMHYFILYSSYVQAITGSSKPTVDIAKVSCILGGIVFVVLGNIMTKAKTNSVVGVRTVWSMHNDVTWAKSNRFGGIALIIVGVLTIITAIFAEAMLATGLMLVYLFVSVIIMIIYSYRVYKTQINK